MATEKDLEAELVDIATRVEKLRVRYQGFFVGLEKLPPLFERDQLERQLRVSALNDVRKAIFKFRFQALIQRYRTMAVYWDRVMRELEEGRVTRESMRREAGYATGTAAERAQKDAQAAADRAADNAPGKPADRGTTPLPKPLPEPPPPADPMQRLYTSYLSARQSLGISNEGVTEAAFRAGLEKQRQTQVQRLGVPDVTFSVVVKEGRVVLLARPVTEPSGP